MLHAVLEESSQHKDPLFLLEMALHNQSIDGSLTFEWIHGFFNKVMVIIWSSEKSK